MLKLALDSLEDQMIRKKFLFVLGAIFGTGLAAVLVLSGYLFLINNPDETLNPEVEVVMERHRQLAEQGKDFAQHILALKDTEIPSLRVETIEDLIAKPEAVEIIEKSQNLIEQFETAMSFETPYVITEKFAESVSAGFVVMKLSNLYLANISYLWMQGKSELALQKMERLNNFQRQVFRFPIPAISGFTTLKVMSGVGEAFKKNRKVRSVPKNLLSQKFMASFAAPDLKVAQESMRQGELIEFTNLIRHFGDRDYVDLTVVDIGEKRTAEGGLFELMYYFPTRLVFQVNATINEFHFVNQFSTLEECEKESRCKDIYNNRKKNRSYFTKNKVGKDAVAIAWNLDVDKKRINRIEEIGKELNQLSDQKG